MKVYRTGQELCYDASGLVVPCENSGQDGEHRRGVPWPAVRFRSVQVGVIEDLVTGLKWTQDANPLKWPLTWDEAHLRLSEMNMTSCCGRNDWRMPSRKELRSLLCHQETRPPLPVGHPFRNVFAGWYWTGTTVADHEEYAWYVHFGGGRTFYGAKKGYYLLWPVAGQSLSEDVPVRVRRFEPEGEGARDRLTGLTWSLSASTHAGEVTWEEAFREIERLNFREGESNWRMPNINELESLVDLARFGPALSRGHPFAGVGDTYWSSTTSTYEPEWAWALYLHKGAVGVGRKSYARFGLWPVRDTETL